MRLRAALILIGMAICWATPAQDPPAPPPAKPAELYKSARDHISEGKYDLGAEELKRFLDAKPGPEVYLDLQNRYGSNTFLQLRNVIRWSDNAKAEADAKKVVEEILLASDAANATVYRNPARILKFVNNLIARTKEERIYARQQLKLAGDAAVPEIVNVLRSTRDTEHQAELLSLMVNLNDSTVPGFLAALEGMPASLQPAYITTLVNRPDVLELVRRAETDFTPILWYLVSDPTESTLRKTCREILSALTNGASDRKRPSDELTRLALPYYQRKGEFRTLDKMKSSVSITTWNKDKLALQTDVVPVARAEEFYGLRNLRWALERKPDSVAAQELFVALATERAVERAKFGDLSATEPEVYSLLAAVPSGLLVSMLDTALVEKRTSLALGLIQALSDRAHKETSDVVEMIPPGKALKPTPIVKALTYEDDTRVQFAAAVAILRSPGQSQHGQSARIVNILRRALAGEIDGSGAGKQGRVIITDPDAARGNKLASLFRDLGFTAERFATGRELLQRIAKASDYDLIVLDRHSVAPQLPDLLSQIHGDPQAARRPTLIVASTNKLVPVPFEHQLLRLAMLVAVTANDETIPDPDPTPNRPTLVKREAIDSDGKLKEFVVTITQIRDGNLKGAFETRSARLQRLIVSADLPQNSTLQAKLDLRRDQFTWAALVAQYQVTLTSAPNAFKQLQDIQATLQKRTDLEGVAERLPASTTDNLVRIIEKLESVLDDEQRKQFEILRRNVLPNSLGLTSDAQRDLELERQLTRQAKPYKFASVIPEVFSSETLIQDVQNAVSDPAQLPRDPAERLSTAKIAASWLRKIAIGEVPNYDIRPAAPDLLNALKNDDFAETVVEAVERLNSVDAQRELVELAGNSKRPVPLRMKATESALRHIQAFGKQVSKPLAEATALAEQAETDPALKAKLSILSRQVSFGPADLSNAILTFPISPVLPAAPKPVDPKEPKLPEPKPVDPTPKLPKM